MAVQDGGIDYLANNTIPPSGRTGLTGIYPWNADNTLRMIDQLGNISILGPIAAVSPLTTKGDLWTYSTVNARLGVGANNTLLVADSAQATGNKWSAALTGLTINNSIIGGSTPAAGTFTGLTATSITSTGLIQTTLVTEQLRLRYDVSNYASFTVSSGGDLTIAPIGGDTTITGTLTASGAFAATTGTFTGAVSIAPATDVVPMTLNGPSGAVANLAELKANGTIKALITSDGRAAFGRATITDANTLLDTTVTMNLAGSGTQAIYNRQNPTITLITANQTATVAASNLGISFNQNGFNLTSAGSLRGINATVAVTGATGTVVAATGTVSTVNNTGAGALTRGANYYAPAQVNNGGGTHGTAVSFASEKQVNATNNITLYSGTLASIPTSQNWELYLTTTYDSSILGNSRFGSNAAPTAKVHVAAGTTAASTAPLKFTTGTSMTSAEAGAMEYTTDDLFFTISTSTARKRLLMADAVGGLTSGRVPFGTTNGRLLDSADLTFNDTTNVVAVTAGTGSGAAKLGGGFFDHSATSTVGGAEADIYTDTLPANTFAVNGDKVSAYYAGNFVTVGTESVQLKVYLAGTAIWDSTGVAVTTGTTSWAVRVEVIRPSSTTLAYVVTLNTSGASAFTYATSGVLTGLTLTNTAVLKITGTSTGVGSGSGDIIGNSAAVFYYPSVT